MYLSFLQNTKLESYSQRLVFKNCCLLFCFHFASLVLNWLCPSLGQLFYITVPLTKEREACPETPRKSSFFLCSSVICIIMVNKYFHKDIPSHTEPSPFLDILSFSWGGWACGGRGGWLEPNKDWVCGYPEEVRDHSRVEVAKLKVQNQTAVCSSSNYEANTLKITSPQSTSNNKNKNAKNEVSLG